MFGFYIVGLLVKPYLVLLTPFRPILSFFVTPPLPPKEKHQKTSCFLELSGGIQRKKLV